MPKVIDLSGQRFGRLTVIAQAGKMQNGRIAWKVVCDCGNETVVSGHELKQNRTKSCGCSRKKKDSHSHSQNTKRANRIYTAWRNMRNRCNNSKHPLFKYYGGRGVEICKEWDVFKNFHDWAMYNGYSDGLTLDRVDVNGNYEPSNCRWVDMKVQANNKRNNRKLTLQGETHTVAEWVAITGINSNVIRSRIRYGWTDEKILTTPIK